MDIAHRSSYNMTGWRYEDDNALRDARSVLKETEEWQNTLRNGFNGLGRERRTKDIYEVLSVFGKNDSEVQNIRIKQLVRERIKTLEPEVKDFPDVSRKERLNLGRSGPSAISTKGVKLIPTPLPRVAFLSRRSSCLQEKKEMLVSHQDHGKVPLNYSRGPSNKPDPVPRHLSQLLERPWKRSLYSDHSQGLLPVIQYFSPSVPAAVPVLPSCKVLKRSTVPPKDRKAQEHVPKTQVKREDRVAVVTVESKHRKRHGKEKLQVQILPSISIESHSERKKKKPNTALLFCFGEQEGNDEREFLPTTLIGLPTDKISAVASKHKISSGQEIDTMVHPGSSTSFTQKTVSAVDSSTQTNGEDRSEKTTDCKYFKHFLQQVVEEGLVSKLKTMQVSKQEAATETQFDQERSTDIQSSGPVETRDTDIQTDFFVQLKDKETSTSEPPMEVKDAAVWTTVKTENAEVQLDKIYNVSVALSPIQELLVRNISEKEVDARPVVVDGSTSPAFADQHAIEPESSSNKSHARLQPNKPAIRPSRLQESSSSSYLTDTTSSTTGTTTTTSSEEHISEGELLFRKPSGQIAYLPSLSEGEILPDMIYSGVRDEMNSSRSEGQLLELSSTGASQSTAHSKTPDGDQQDVLQSTGEISLRPLSTDHSGSS